MTTPEQPLHDSDEPRRQHATGRHGDGHIHCAVGNERPAHPGELHRAGPTFSDSTAYQQVIYQQATGTFAPGTHSLTVQIPNCYYQIDFVCGPAINQLEPNQNG